MKKILFVIVILFLISGIHAKIDEKALNKNLKDSLIKETLDESGTTAQISEKLKNTAPEMMEDINEVCEKTKGIRTSIKILSILAIFGLITFPPAGIIVGVIDLFIILNYTCWFSF